MYHLRIKHMRRPDHHRNDAIMATSFMRPLQLAIPRSCADEQGLRCLVPKFALCKRSVVQRTW